MYLENRKITTRTSTENWALSLDEAKLHLNILDNSFDELISDYIDAAHQQLWSECNILIAGTYVGYLPCFKNFYLTVTPYSSVVIEYFNSANTLTTLSTDDYYVNEGNDVFIEIINGASVYDRKFPIKVTVTTGANTDKAVTQALRMVVADMFENRQSDSKGAVGKLSRNTKYQLTLISQRTC